MMANYIEINNCKHYFLNQEKKMDVYFITNNLFVEKDLDTRHPLGVVFKPRGCIDTLIRFVRQSDNTTLMFRFDQWNKKTNPFCVKTKWSRESQ